uniref:Uncharacterized protein n=1 Tax=viral metagenome TaxID=1070528 RepID=A0A6M3JUK6_9ZZZZ
MLLDSSLILLDGSIDLAPATDTPPISTTRDAATGAAVLDLRTTGWKGLAAVLVMADAASNAGDTLTAFLEASDTEDMTGTVTGITELGKFGIADATKGIILGSEVPAIVVLRFATYKRYLRLNATVSADDSFYTVYCYVTPHPFYVVS